MFRTLLGLLLCLTAGAQPAFEVASIKPAAPDARGMYIRLVPGGGLNVTNMTLKDLITYAYRIQPFQVSGGPPWLDGIHYDILAKPENQAKQDEVPRMLQALLADRFQLTLHRETKELPVYALVLARKDGKLGPGLVETKPGSCQTPDPTGPRPQPGQPMPKFCGGMMMSPKSMTATSIPVGNLIPMLSRLLGRTVVDRTALTGNYDISMEWTPDESQTFQLPPDAPKPDATAAPSLFTAFQEQLGLKLEPQKGPVEIFIVDRAEKPSEN